MQQQHQYQALYLTLLSKQPAPADGELSNSLQCNSTCFLLSVVYYVLPFQRPELVT
jgi:hypothetical protein